MDKTMTTPCPPKKGTRERYWYDLQQLKHEQLYAEAKRIDQVYISMLKKFIILHPGVIPSEYTRNIEDRRSASIQSAIQSNDCLQLLSVHALDAFDAALALLHYDKKMKHRQRLNLSIWDHLEDIFF